MKEMNPIRCNVATLVCMIFASLFLFGYVILCSGIAILVSVHFYIHCICPTSLTFRARYFNEDELQRRAIHIVADIVNSHNETRCRNNFRVDRTRFLRLCEILQNDIEETPSMPISVQVAIYLHWIANAATLRQQRETFQREMHFLFPQLISSVLYNLIRYSSCSSVQSILAFCLLLFFGVLVAAFLFRVGSEDDWFLED